MRQIPSGEYCGECPCFDPWRGMCWLFGVKLGGFDNANRCPQCLRYKPQVMTEEERQILELKGFQKGIAQAATNIYTPKEDIENEL